MGTILYIIGIILVLTKSVPESVPKAFTFEAYDNDVDMCGKSAQPYD